MYYHENSSLASSAHLSLDYDGAARQIIDQQFASGNLATDMRHLVDCTNLMSSRFRTPASSAGLSCCARNGTADPVAEDSRWRP